MRKKQKSTTTYTATSDCITLLFIVVLNIEPFAFGSWLYVQYNTATHVVNITYKQGAN